MPQKQQKKSPRSSCCFQRIQQRSQLSKSPASTKSTHASSFSPCSRRPPIVRNSVQKPINLCELQNQLRPPSLKPVMSACDLPQPQEKQQRKSTKTSLSVPQKRISVPKSVIKADPPLKSIKSLDDLQLLEEKQRKSTKHSLRMSRFEKHQAVTKSQHTQTDSKQLKDADCQTDAALMQCIESESIKTKGVDAVSQTDAACSEPKRNRKKDYTCLEDVCQSKASMMSHCEEEGTESEDEDEDDDEDACVCQAYVAPKRHSESKEEQISEKEDEDGCFCHGNPKLTQCSESEMVKTKCNENACEANAVALRAHARITEEREKCRTAQGHFIRANQEGVDIVTTINEGLKAVTAGIVPYSDPHDIFMCRWDEEIQKKVDAFDSDSQLEEVTSWQSEELQTLLREALAPLEHETHTLEMLFEELHQKIAEENKQKKL